MATDQNLTESIEISKIDPNPVASRFEQPDLGELIASFKSQGQLTPIKVRFNPRDSGRYQLIYGHRRLTAARALGWDRISAEVIQASDKEMLTFALSENLERDNYTDYEVALLLRRLHEEFRDSIDQIAAMLGKSKAYVSQHIAMASMFEFPGIDQEEATDALKRLSERQARVLSRIADPLERLRLAKICIKEKLGVVACERFIGHPRQVIAEGNVIKVEGWRTSKARAEEQIAEIIQETLRGLEKKDLSPLFSHRMRDSFTSFDNFPPFGLLNYQQAAEQNLLILRHTDKIKLSYDDLKVHVFGRFAYATFFVNYLLHYSTSWHPMRSRVTFNFIRKENDWFIIHEHWSPLQSESMPELTNYQT